MGRQAKRKQQRRAAQASASPPSSQTQRTQPQKDQQFVRNFAQRGYALQDSLQSPPLPETKPEPEV
ncbi:MAG: hypothetical protein AAGG51_06315 [Cyanobacteria bacterium P01_G01_bin.54]